MAERTLNTKIKLRYASYAEWQASSVKLLAGEVALCYVEENNSEIKNTAPTVLFKVGDGEHVFKDLKWASARAADVYDWAKAENLSIEKSGTGNVVASIRWDTTNKKFIYETASVATSEGLEDLQKTVATLTSNLNTLAGRVGVNEGAIAGLNTEVAKKLNSSDFETFKEGYNGTIEGINNLVSSKADASSLSDYYTKIEADGKFLTGHQDISGKADKSYVDKELGKKANTSYVNDELAKKVDLSVYNERVTAVDNRFGGIDGKISGIEGGIADINEELGLIGGEIEDINDELALKAVKSEVETALAGKVDNATLDGYYKKGEIDTAVNGLDSRITANANAIEALTNGTSAEEIDSVMDLIAYVNEHGTEVQGMKDGIKANKDAIDALDGRVDVVEGDIKTLKEETIPGLSSRIKDYEDNKGTFALKSELFSGSYNDLKDKPNLNVYETIANVDKVREDVSTIKGDYLKGSDKTELSNAISTEKGRIDGLVDTTIPGLEGRISTLEGKPFDTYATKSEVEAVDGKANGIDNRLKVVEGDYLKGSDKTTLENAISTAVAGEKSRAEAAEKGLGDRLTAVETNFLSSADVIVWDCGGAN